MSGFMKTVLKNSRPGRAFFSCKRKGNDYPASRVSLKNEGDSTRRVGSNDIKIKKKVSFFPLLV